MKIQAMKCRQSAWLTLMVSAALVVSACGGNDGADPEPVVAAASFTSIQQDVLSPRCNQCHAGETPAGSLSLMVGQSYSQLFNVQATRAPNVRVVPGDSASSFLIRKLRGTDLLETEGSRMPLSGPYLDDATIDSIAQWIDAGALDN